MSEGKICTKCYVFKSFVNYHKDRKNPSGYNSQCNECRKPLRQLHYQNNKEKYKSAFQDFMIRNPDYFKLYNSREKKI